MVQLPSGKRIEHLRRSQGLPRRVLAERVGRSEEWLRQIERGKRELDSISVLTRLAEILPFDNISQVVGPVSEAAPQRGSGSWATEIIFPPSDQPGENPMTDNALHTAWDAWQFSPNRYTNTRKALSGLLGSAGSGTAENMAESYRLMSSVLRHEGAGDLALLTAEMACEQARTTRQPLLVAAARGSLAEALGSAGRSREARTVARSTVDLLNDVDEKDAVRLSVVGTAHLTAALAAAAEGDHNGAEALADQASAVADLIGEERNDLRTSFGPLDVSAHAVRIDVRLGRYRRALRTADRTDIHRMFSRERRARHFIAVAAAYSFERDAPGGVFALCRAEEACPEELRFHPHVPAILERLMELECATVRPELLRIARRSRADT
ncbi:helix-turn-helix protein [Haloactinospora alba]|uniref:Helix-turn-helix protein n=1 Tax=Haloactinospora alba TaxID=405555 RepID=A0A543NNQ6_9ACTN|nr:helix-turn-helix transcriptional regulator [Haloactinospora alba]TQN33464.1 helix-turn-helix protein [Haloactinospora alba]